MGRSLPPRTRSGMSQAAMIAVRIGSKKAVPTVSVAILVTPHSGSDGTLRKRYQPMPALSRKLTIAGPMISSRMRKRRCSRENVSAMGGQCLTR